MNKLIEGLDYIIDERTGYFILTAHFLLKRGKCCGNKCLNCPYEPKAIRGNTNTKNTTNPFQ